MPEIFRTSLLTDHPPEKLHLIISTIGDQRWITLEVSDSRGSNQSEAPARRLTLPLSLWPRFYEAVNCLGAFMKPLPSPAYQATSCCSCLCPPSPEPVVLEQADQKQIHLSLQDRRGSTFLEIKTVSPAENPSGEAAPILVSPTRWSAFLSAVQRLDQITTDLGFQAY
jgi:hypothetical protein